MPKVDIYNIDCLLYTSIFLLAILIACTGLINRCDRFNRTENTNQDELKNDSLVENQHTGVPLDNAVEKSMPDAEEKLSLIHI